MTTAVLKPLAELVELADSGTWGEPAPAGNGAPVLRSTNIIDNRFDLTDVATRAVPPNHRATKRLAEGDIIVVSSSGSPDHIGKCALFSDPRDDRSYYFSNFTLRLRPNRNEVDSRWLFYWLTSARGRALLNAMNATTSGLRNLNKGLYLSQRIPLKPLAQQRRIAGALDKADAICRKRRETIALLDELLCAVFLEMFGHPVTNEKGWPVLSLGEIGEVVTGTTPATDRPVNYGSTGIPFVRPADLGSMLPVEATAVYISDQGREFAAVLPERGAVFFCGIGATIGKVGYARARAATNQQIHAVVPRDARCPPEYLTMVLRLSKEAIVSRAVTTTLPILKKSEFERYKIPVPPPDLAAAFTAAFDRSLLGLRLRQRFLQSAQALFHSLADRAFRGEL